MTDLKILYVDDEPENLFSFQASLRRSFEVLTAENATDALALLESEPVGVLLCDQRMPGMTGAELLALANERWPHVTRILVTGYSDLAVVTDAVNRGHIYQYVAKPWGLDDLRLVLTNALQKTRLTLENQALISEKHQLELATLRAEKSAYEARWQALHSKLQPHFLFNALNTIPPLIRSEPDKAVVFTQSLAKLLRLLAEPAEAPLSPLAREVAVGQHYLLLQGIRFEHKLHVHWQLPEPLPERALPRLALQLVLENALKHNEITRERPLQVWVELNEDHSALLVRNSRQERREAEEGLGIGLDNIRQRYALLGDFVPATRADDAWFVVALPLI